MFGSQRTSDPRDAEQRADHTDGLGKARGRVHLTTAYTKELPDSSVSPPRGAFRNLGMPRFRRRRESKDGLIRGTKINETLVYQGFENGDLGEGTPPGHSATEILFELHP